MKSDVKDVTIEAKPGDGRSVICQLIHNDSADRTNDETVEELGICDFVSHTHIHPHTLECTSHNNDSYI